MRAPGRHSIKCAQKGKRLYQPPPPPPPPPPPDDPLDEPELEVSGAGNDDWKEPAIALAVAPTLSEIRLASNDLPEYQPG